MAREACVTKFDQSDNGMGWQNWLMSLEAEKVIPALALFAIVAGLALSSCDLSLAAETAAKIANKQSYGDWAQSVGTVTTVIAAWAAVVAAKAASDSVKVARDTADKELRAHVGVVPQIVSHKEGPPEYRIAVRNYGQTPAYSCSVWSKAAIKPYPLEPDEKFERTYPEVRFTLYKDGPPFGLNGRFGRLLTPDEIEGIFAGQLGLYIWGEVVYFDASKTERRTAFRYVFGGKVVGTFNLEMCSEGNDST